MSHSKRKTTKGSNSSNASREQYTASTPSSILRRIRTPHPHDVLCGRGGGINSHAGNVTFRQWVAERKNDYNLASNKVEKAQVATEVMDLVKRLRPPGRFLARDESTGSSGLVTWWVEIDASKAMAKTSQALREGAPSIRAKHTGVTPRKRRSGSSSSSGTKRRGSMDTMLPPPPIEASEVALATAFEAAQLQAAAQATTASLEEAPLFPATLLTPKLAPTVMSSLPARTPELTSLPAPLHDSGSMVRSHSLALSDMSHHDFLQEDFVNPFEEEQGGGGDNHHPHAPTNNNNNKRPRPSPPSSHGDMGGLGALLGGGGGISSSSNSFNHVFTHHPLGSRGMTKNSNNSSSGSNSGGTTSRAIMESPIDLRQTVSPGDLERLKTDNDDEEAEGVLPTTPTRSWGSALTRRLSPQLARVLGHTPIKKARQ